MNESEFYKVASNVYLSCKDTWEGRSDDTFSPEMSLIGGDSTLSSLDVVTFLAELETHLLNYNLNISFLDKILVLGDKPIKISDLYGFI